MTREKQASNEGDELKSINDELLKRRETIQNEEIMQYGNIFSAVKNHVVNGEYDLARELAKNLQETHLYGEIVNLFRNNPETFLCKDCSKKIGGFAFKKDSLTWIKPDLCDNCAEHRNKIDKENQIKLFSSFIDRNMIKILKAIGVKGRLLDASYDGFPFAIVQSCMRSVTAKHGLFIHGDVGRGKSWLSVAVLKDLITNLYISLEKQRKLMYDIDMFRNLFRFIFVPKLLADIRATYGTGDYQAEQSIIEEHMKVPVLVLDDIGVEKPSEWVREKLNMIVDYRNNNLMKTLYTSNKDPNSLKERLDERLTSRIIQQCEIVNLIGPDRRIQGS